MTDGDTSRTDPAPIIIKKYANRRLYDTEKSSYITLENIAEMTRKGVHFQVVDAKTGEDITHNILTQIIMDEEARGATMLPVNFLRQLITLYGDSMQAMVPQYLENSLSMFQKNQQQFQNALQGALSGGPLAEITKRNIEMFEAATKAFRPQGMTDGGASDASGAAPATDDRDAEIARLKAEIERLKQEK